MILDYSVWYSNNSSEPNTYIEYIQSIACECITETKFITQHIIKFIFIICCLFSHFSKYSKYSKH